MPRWGKQSEVFYTSDTHFAHRLVADLRGFDSVEEHDQALIERWNAVVRPQDIVWHLGDVTLKNIAAVADTLAALNGTIHLVLGNHDRAHPCFRKAWKHMPAYTEAFASVQTMARHHFGGLPVMLSHYPYAGEGERDIPDRQEWARLRDVGTPLLHGHTHSASRQDVSPAGTPQVHVGWDAWGEPVHRERLVSLLPQ